MYFKFCFEDINFLSEKKKRQWNEALHRYVIVIKVAIKARLGKYWHLCFDQALPFCQLPSHRWLCCKTWSFLSDRRISPGQFGSPPSLFSGLPLIKKKWRMMNKDCYPVLLLTKYYSWLLYFSINLRWTGSRRLSLIHTCFIYLLLMCGKNLSAARNIRDNESLTKLAKISRTRIKVCLQYYGNVRVL